jgi:hypothetical protein
VRPGDHYHILRTIDTSTHMAEANTAKKMADLKREYNCCMPNEQLKE